MATSSGAKKDEPAYRQLDDADASPAVGPSAKELRDGGGRNGHAVMCRGY